MLTIAPSSRSRDVPDEVGTVAAERRLFKEASDERMLFDTEDILLTQRTSSLDAVSRRPAAPRVSPGTGGRAATAVSSGTRRGHDGWQVSVVVDFVIHRETRQLSSTAHHFHLVMRVKETWKETPLPLPTPKSFAQHRDWDALELP